MADVSAKELASKLRGDRFQPRGPELVKASDPIADTAMVVTLDELRPYELNPRIVRNPRYEDIKASIRERGLEAPPAITRRPGEEHYIIRNGGNTRLSVLNELWRETKEERFFRISCLFRPWTTRGEILALTGHLAENELRGELTFIERALGVDKLRELHEGEKADTLTQKELSDRLRRDGYPIGQSHISRMQDAIRHLLPSIPKILYGGLGKHQIERLIALRRGAQRIFERHASKKGVNVDFDALFHDVSAAFDLEPTTFNVQRLQDELIGQMASLFGQDYDALMLALVDAETWQRSLLRKPAMDSETASLAKSAPDVAPSLDASPHAQARGGSRVSSASQAGPIRPSIPADEGNKHRSHERHEESKSSAPVQAQAPVQGNEKRLPQTTTGSEPIERESASQVHPAAQPAPRFALELWQIAPGLDEPSHLREHIAKLALEIGQKTGIAPSIRVIDGGIGFECHSAELSPDRVEADGIRAHATLRLLSALSSCYAAHRPAIEGDRIEDDLAPLLQGTFHGSQVDTTDARLSDEGLLRLFRLIRLARRLVDHESGHERHANSTRGHP